MSDANTVRDYRGRPDVVSAVEDARDTLVTCWSEWEADADQQAQREQDNEAYFDAMNAQVETVLYGMLDRIPDAAPGRAELLAACEAALVLEEAAASWRRNDALLAQLRAAIAKAKGGS